MYSLLMSPTDNTDKRPYVKGISRLDLIYTFHYKRNNTSRILDF